MNPWVAHLIELRRRILIALLAVLVGAVGAYLFKEPLLHLLLWPLDRAAPARGVVFTGLPDMFFIYLKLAIYTGVAVAFPVLCWQLWRFVAPGLYGGEQRVAWPYLVLTPLLFYTGVAFSHFVVMPLAVQFFFSFEQPGIQALPALKEYFSFTLKMLLAFGLAFTLPVFILLAVQLGWVQVTTLARSRRYVIVAVVVAGALMTPPDPLSQVILAVPLYLLFESALFLARWVGKDATKKAD